MREKYLSEGIGTYTRPNGDSDTWTKQSTSTSDFTLVGKWSLVEGLARDDPEKIELLRDGTGNFGNVTGNIVARFSWKAENSWFIISTDHETIWLKYQVSGSTLTLIDDSRVIRYRKE